MDKPADPATPFREVYQHFLAVLKKHGRKDGADPDPWLPGPAGKIEPG